MSKTLNLTDRVLARGRHLHELGFQMDAQRMLGRLANWQQLPDAVAEETQARLADIHLRDGHYTQARRHLAAALAHRPDNARYHYLLATALDAGETNQAEAAYKHYRRSLELDPNQADCLSDFGLLALRLDRNEEGLQALRQAVAVAPDDAVVVGKLLDGLRRCGLCEEARLTLRAALFRNPRSYAFAKLWSTFRFEQACQAQQMARQHGGTSTATDKPVLLPFLRLADNGAPKPRHGRRHGLLSPFTPPHGPRSTQVPDRKHA